MIRPKKKSALPKMMSLDEAIVFGFFIQQCCEAISYHLVDGEGYFFVSKRKQLHDIPISTKQHRVAITKLLERGYLGIKKSCSSPRCYYKVYIDNLLLDINPL